MLEISIQEMKNNLPFKEESNTDHVIRTFSSELKEDELKWHFDNENRRVTFLHDTDWRFQRDNQLPIKIYEGMEVTISEGEYHRIIKGTGDLKVKVIKSF